MLAKSHFVERFTDKSQELLGIVYDVRKLYRVLQDNSDTISTLDATFTVAIEYVLDGIYRTKLTITHKGLLQRVVIPYIVIHDNVKLYSYTIEDLNYRYTAGDYKVILCKSITDYNIFIEFIANELVKIDNCSFCTE